MTFMVFNMGMDTATANQFIERLEFNQKNGKSSIKDEVQFGETEIRRFPDGESYLNVLSDVAGLHCVLLIDASVPDEQFLQWIFMAENLKELGAESVGCLIPYLPYMRQDIRFKPGECVTSRHFAKLMSQSFDWLMTSDPHLHRYDCLSEIYSIPTHIVPAAPAIAHWIKANVKNPLIVGPDMESEQWVSDVAGMVGCDYEVLLKERSGDREVEVSLPKYQSHRNQTPVLVDDIISTGQTMAKAVGSLIASGMNPPVCIGVHPLFSDACVGLLTESGAAQVVSCNTLMHPTAQINMVKLWADAFGRWVRTLELVQDTSLEPYPMALAQ